MKIVFIMVKAPSYSLNNRPFLIKNLPDCLTLGMLHAITNRAFPDIEIEIYDEGTWKEMEVEMIFNMPLMELKSSKEIKLNFDWEHSHGKLKGKYRIIKDVYFENEEKFFIACEFEV